jgi:hypothetical protein
MCKLSHTYYLYRIVYPYNTNSQKFIDPQILEHFFTPWNMCYISFWKTEKFWPLSKIVAVYFRECQTISCPYIFVNVRQFHVLFEKKTHQNTWTFCVYNLMIKLISNEKLWKHGYVPVNKLLPSCWVLTTLWWCFWQPWNSLNCKKFTTFSRAWPVPEFHENVLHTNFSCSTVHNVL